MRDNVKEVLDGLVARFASGDIPEAIAYASFPTADSPSARWSLLNRTLMFFAGTGDARGIRQWNEIGRHVKKGSKALYIIVPFFKKTTDDTTGEEKQVLATFSLRPVFRYEDTDGDPLPESQHIELPNLPLMEKAQSWGLEVKAIPGNYRYYGYYRSSTKEICLATPAEKVFFHELSHAAHDRIVGGLKGGQDPLQEIIAELAAQAISVMVGKDPKDHIGNSFRYIESYAGKAKMSVQSACLKVISTVEKIISLILEPEELKTC